MDLKDKVNDLQHDLDYERQHHELKSKVKELDKLKKDLTEKDKRNDLLKLAIDKLNEKMMQYEIQKSNVTED